MSKQEQDREKIVLEAHAYKMKWENKAFAQELDGPQALINVAALVNCLVKAGVITELDFFTALRDLYKLALDGEHGTFPVEETELDEAENDE